MLVHPSEVKMRKKQRKVSNEVADLKQKLSLSMKNVVLSNREIRLLRYSSVVSGLLVVQTLTLSAISFSDS